MCLGESSCPRICAVIHLSVFSLCGLFLNPSAVSVLVSNSIVYPANPFFTFLFFVQTCFSAHPLVCLPLSHYFPSHDSKSSCLSNYNGLSSTLFVLWLWIWIATLHLTSKSNVSNIYHLIRSWFRLKYLWWLQGVVIIKFFQHIYILCRLSTILFFNLSLLYLPHIPIQLLQLPPNIYSLSSQMTLSEQCDHTLKMSALVRNISQQQ